MMIILNCVANKGYGNKWRYSKHGQRSGKSKSVTGDKPNSLIFAAVIMPSEVSDNTKEDQGIDV